MQYLPSCRVRSVKARAEMPVHSPLAAAGAAVAPVPRVDATSLLAAESAPACACAAVGHGRLRGLLHLGNGISERCGVGAASSPFLSSPDCKENCSGF